MDEAKAIGDCKLRNEDFLNLQVQQITICATRALSRAAFAVVLGDGSVVTWGSASAGGASRAVQDQLKNVQQIQASDSAFAAILADGSVVTWGDADFGGDSNAVQDQLKNVQQIQASSSAFAAILADGSVVTWGDVDFGGDSSAAQDQLKNVQQIQANYLAFAAILADGSVVTWGNPAGGGDSRAVQNQLKNVQQIQANSYAFGSHPCRWICGDLGQSWLRWREQCVARSTEECAANSSQFQFFAAILADGSVVTWGHADFGGDNSAVQDQLRVSGMWVVEP